MTTEKEQAEFLDSIMHELDSDPDTSPQDKQLLKSASEFLKPLIKGEPETLYAGYRNGYYRIRLNGSATLGTIRELTAEGYKLQFLEPPFGKPIMLKKRS